MAEEIVWPIEWMNPEEMSYMKVGSWILTEPEYQEYQEYQELKKFKEEADREVEEWDKGIEVSIPCCCECILNHDLVNQEALDNIEETAKQHIADMIWPDQEAQCNQCLHPDAKGIHTCERYKPNQDTTENRHNKLALDFYIFKDVQERINNIAEESWETHEDRLDDIEAEIRSDRKTQKLINEVQNDRLRNLEQMVKGEGDVRSEREDQRGFINWSFEAQPYSDNLQDMETGQSERSGKETGKRRGRPKKSA